MAGGADPLNATVVVGVNFNFQTIALSSVPKKILDAAPSRVRLRLSPDGASTSIYLGFGAPPSPGSRFFLRSGYDDFDPETCFRGELWASGIGSVAVMDGTETAVSVDKPPADAAPVTTGVSWWVTALAVVASIAAIWAAVRK